GRRSAAIDPTLGASVSFQAEQLAVDGLHGNQSAIALGRCQSLTGHPALPNHLPIGLIQCNHPAIEQGQVQMLPVGTESATGLCLELLFPNLFAVRQVQGYNIPLMAQGKNSVFNNNRAEGWQFAIVATDVHVPQPSQLDVRLEGVAFGGLDLYR